MDQNTKSEFLKLLAKTMAAYGKTLPETGIVNAWVDELKGFPMPVISAAFAAYKAENDTFPPTPVGIANRCREMDGRPTDAEAWATALTSLDEESTIIYSTETEIAFGIARPILNMGDEVGARMAFRDAYNRLVAEARMAGRPIKWSVSLGHDKKQQAIAIERGISAGLLPAPTAQALLSYSPETTAAEVDVKPEGLKRLKVEIAKLRSPSERSAELRSASVEAEKKRKNEINERVRLYQSDHERSAA